MEVLENAAPHISATDIRQEFESRDGSKVLALSPTSLQMANGEFVCLVGPSGCGKTTLLNIAAGLLTPTDGQMLIDGHAPRLGDLDVGYLLARDSLMPWRTAVENVQFPLELRHMNRREAKEQAGQALVDVGLGSFLNSYPSQLSHGMRQRTALARTLVTNPKTLLMDEPFSALDAETRLQLQDRFLRLWEKRRSTVMFVTHDLSEAIALGDRILVFGARPGRIVAEFNITLPRPRSILDLQGDEQYHELFQQIWKIFRREVQV